MLIIARVFTSWMTQQSSKQQAVDDHFLEGLDLECQYYPLEVMDSWHDLKCC